MLLKKSILCGFIVTVLLSTSTMFTGCTDNVNNTADEDETLVGTWVSDILYKVIRALGESGSLPFSPYCSG